MTEQLEPWVTPVAPIVAPRLMLDMIAGQRNDEDLVDRLLLDAVIIHNLQPVIADLELQVRFGAADTPPPDTTRQPMSMSALTAYMSMPAETVRRRTHRLADEGKCLITPSGVIVTAEQVMARYDEEHLQRIYDTTVEGYRQLRSLGFFTDPPLPRCRDAAHGPPALRPVVRLAGVFTHRALELAADRMGNRLNVILLGTMSRENMIPVLPLIGIGDRPAAAPSSELIQMLRPLTISRLAPMLRLDPETTRRRVIRLARLGYCERREEGYVVSFAFMRSPAVVSTYEDQRTNLWRLYEGCAEIGCLDAWEAAAA